MEALCNYYNDLCKFVTKYNTVKHFQHSTVLFPLPLSSHHYSGRGCIIEEENVSNVLQIVLSSVDGLKSVCSTNGFLGF